MEKAVAAGTQPIEVEEKKPPPETLSVSMFKMSRNCQACKIKKSKVVMVATGKTSGKQAVHFFCSICSGKTMAKLKGD